MARVRTDWSIEGPLVDEHGQPVRDERGQPVRGIIGSGSTTGDVYQRCRELLQRHYAGDEYTISISVVEDTRLYYKHADGGVEGEVRR